MIVLPSPNSLSLKKTQIHQNYHGRRELFSTFPFTPLFFFLPPLLASLEAQTASSKVLFNTLGVLSLFNSSVVSYSTPHSLPPSIILSLRSIPFLKFWDLSLQNQFCLFQEALTLHTPHHHAPRPLCQQPTPASSPSGHQVPTCVCECVSHTCRCVTCHLPPLLLVSLSHLLARVWLTRASHKPRPYCPSPTPPSTYAAILCNFFFLVFMLFSCSFRALDAFFTIYGTLSIWLQIVLRCSLDSVPVSSYVGFDSTFISVFSAVVVLLRVCYCCFFDYDISSAHFQTTLICDQVSWSSCKKSIRLCHFI